MSCAEDDHGGAAVQSVPRSHDLPPRLSKQKYFTLLKNICQGITCRASPGARGPSCGFLKMAKMDPMETRQSMLELPSRGSKETMYLPWRSVSTSISLSFSCGQTVQLYAKRDQTSDNSDIDISSSLSTTTTTTTHLRHQETRDVGGPEHEVSTEE